jgi:hypothetical protein
MFPVVKHGSHKFTHVFKNGSVSCSSYRIYMEINLRETTADFNLIMVEQMGKVKNTLKFVGQKTQKGCIV